MEGGTLTYHSQDPRKKFAHESSSEVRKMLGCLKRKYENCIFIRRRRTSALYFNEGFWLIVVIVRKSAAQLNLFHLYWYWESIGDCLVGRPLIVLRGHCGVKKRNWPSRILAFAKCLEYLGCTCTCMWPCYHDLLDMIISLPCLRTYFFRHFKLWFDFLPWSPSEILIALRVLAQNVNPPTVGIEPTTLGLKVPCSTDWANRARWIVSATCNDGSGYLLGGGEI